MGDVYLGFPADRQHLQEKKLAKLQEEIAEMEKRIQENVALRQHLESISEAENERTQRVLDRMGSRNMVLKEEIERLYGHHKEPPSSPSPTHLVNEVISQRTKEFSHMQQEKAMQIKYLMIEKQRLHEAQERLRMKRRAMMRQPTPTDGREVPTRRPSISSVHSTSSLVKRTVDAMPKTVGHIKYLREILQHDYEAKKKPYNGELGVKSYQPWQIEDYILIRGLVEEFVDDFIGCYIPSEDGYGERDKIRAVYLSENKDWVSTVQALEDSKILQLVAEEIILQETRAVMRRVAAEVLHVHGTFKNMTDVLMMSEAEKISTGHDIGREEQDSAYSLVTKHYFQLQQHRNLHKRDVWAHSQNLHRPLQPSTQEQVDRLDIDTELITFLHLHPADLKKFEINRLDPPEVRRKKEQASIYKRREAEYWKGMKPRVSRLSLPPRCRGIQCMQPSPDHSHIAIGTAHGDVLVYDVGQEPWKMTRVAHNTAATDDSTIDIAWSLDGLQLLSINQGGSIQLWGVPGTQADRNTIRALALQPDQHGNLPLTLKLLGSLDVDRDDFTFQMGPVKDLGLLQGSGLPTKGVFFPSLSFFGFQHSVCVGLDSGDILKVSLSPWLSSSPSGQPEATDPAAVQVYHPDIMALGLDVNLIGQNLEAEFFRNHSSPVVHLGFVDNINRLVSVDKSGHISIWKYAVSKLIEFGYFVPEKKYKLDLEKTMYTPTTSEKSKLIFSDSQTSGRSQADIALERKQVQSALDAMQLGEPWQEETLPDKKLKTSVYAPKAGVKDAGAVFSIVTRHTTTNQISTYRTQMYTPAKVASTKMLSVCQTPSGQRLVFALLFPEYPPKHKPHVTVLALELSTMQLSDLRCDIYLSAADYASLLQDDETFSCDTTRVLGPTGTEYLFIMYNGRVCCISLTTGNLVVRVENPARPSGLPGCIIDEKLLAKSKLARVSSICCDGCIYSLLHDKNSTSITIIQLQDMNEQETRRLVWKSYQLSEHYGHIPADLRVDKVPWVLNNMRYADVEMRCLLLQLVDEKIFHFQPGIDKQADTSRLAQDKTEQYLAMQTKVDKNPLLDLHEESS